MRKVLPEGVPLHRLALAKGATIHTTDGDINASGTRAAFPVELPKPPEPPPAAPKPEPVPLDTAGLERAAQASQKSTEALASVVSMLLAEIKQQRAAAAPAPIKGWEFSVERDDKDRLKRIRATAIR